MGKRDANAGVPDSFTAWLTAASAFIAGFVVFGVMYSFGVFFRPMEAEFHAGRAATSAFYSITGLLFYFSGYVTGRLSDRFGPRPVIGAGAIIMSAGLLLTASAGRMWAGYLAYGAGVGIGAACVYIPTLAIVGGWFIRHRNTALGLAAAGTGCGTLVMPPIAARLIDAHGWRMAYATFGAGAFLLLLICAWLAVPPPLSRTAPARKLRRVVLSRPFVLLYLSWLLATSALGVPLVFLSPSARANGVGPVAAAALVSLIGGMSIIGRAGIGAITRRLGALRLFKLSVLMMGASYLLWLQGTAYGWLAAFAALLGLGYGLRIALLPVVLIDFFGLADLGAILGLFFTSSGISSLCGPLLAGVIIDHAGSYQAGVVFALSLGILGFAAILPLRRHGAERDRLN